MKKFIIMITLFLFCAACGVKGDPKYKVQNNYNRNITII